MWLVIEDHDNLFVMAEVVHFLGIGLLAYKLTKKKNAGGALQHARILVGPPMHEHSYESRITAAPCASMAGSIYNWMVRAGLSLRTQELTALFLAIRLYCRCIIALAGSLPLLLLHGLSLLSTSLHAETARGCLTLPSAPQMAMHMYPIFAVAVTGVLKPPLVCRSFMMEYDVHTVLDLLTLAATAWVIYTLRVTLKDSYQNEQDTIQTYYVVRTGARRVTTYCAHHAVTFKVMIDDHNQAVDAGLRETILGC